MTTKNYFKKTILCYGDSNTWGWDPATCCRLGINQRWPRVMQKQLGDDFEIIEEGLPGRTTVLDDPLEGIHKNGKNYLLPCLESHQPIDLVIIFLGTNDLKARFGMSASDIANGSGVLADIVMSSACGHHNKPPMVLLLSPPVLGKLTDLAEMFKGGFEKSKELSFHFAKVAKEKNCYFLDLATVVRTSDIDGVHLEESEHYKLGTAVAKKVLEIFTR